MQTALQFFDIPTQSGFGAVDKVAVKMPGETDLDPSGKDFAAVMGALQRLAPGELQRSLEALDWVALEGENNGYVPLIDLSNQNGIGAQVLTLLMESPAAEGSVFSFSGDVVRKQISELPQPMASELAVAEMGDGQGQQTGQQAGHLLDSMPLEPSIEAAAEVELTSAKTASGTALASGTAEAATEVKLPSVRTAIETALTEGINNEADDLQTMPVAMARSKPEPPPDDLPRPSLNNAEQRHQGKTGGETNRQGASTLAGQPMFEKNQDGAASLRELAASPVQGSHSTAEQETVEEGEADSGGKSNEPLDRVFQTHGGKANRGTLVASDNAKSMVLETAEREPVAPSREMQNNIIRQIVRRMTLHSSGLKSRMNLQLKPEFLGNVHMQITTEQQQVTVRMTAESIVVKELIEQQIQHLRSELQQHGLEIDKFEVFVGNGSENWKSSQENAAFRRALHRKGSGRTEQPGDDLGEDNDHASDGDKMPLRSRTREIDYFA
jgi:flagellar hook-length control protein FliK